MSVWVDRNIAKHSNRTPTLFRLLDPAFPVRVPPRMIRRCVTQVLMAGIAFYQRGISPLLGQNCRFQPTCSEYAKLAIAKYGPFRGCVKTIGRICRCHPFCRGGVDLP